MRLKTALRRRILELCAQQDLSVFALGKRCGITHTTLCNILNGRNNSTTIQTVQKICEGLEISLPAFFDSDYFRNLEQEIF